MITYDNKIVQEDLLDITSRRNINFEKMRNSTILVTGANGMLATYVVYTIMFLNEKFNYNTKVIALVRNKNKSEYIFNKFINSNLFELLNQDVCESINIKGEVDYIVHAAGAASPKFILSDPVGIIEANTKGTFNVFELGRNKNIKNILFTSTREIYGKVGSSISEIREDNMGVIDCLDSRSCYPESKRIAENICKSYNIQYNVPYTIARIAHSYGPGMEINQDGRVMSDFISDIVNDKNIIINSDGTAQRAFCYITDAVAGMFFILLNGKIGEAYNIANETETVEIKVLAEKLIHLFYEKNLKVEFRIPTQQQKDGYSKYERVKLNTRKLEELGWSPQVKLIDGLKRTVNSFNDNI